MVEYMTCRLQSLQNSRREKRDANAFLYVYSGLTCFILKEPGATGENERKPEDQLPKHAIYLFTV